MDLNSKYVKPEFETLTDQKKTVNAEITKGFDNCFKDILSTMEAENITVTGGGGSPGVFAGGVGAGGNLKYTISLTIKNPFEKSDSLKLLLNSVAIVCKESLDKVLSSYTFTTLTFAGSSTHTPTAPGKLESVISGGILGIIGKVDKSELENIANNIKAKLTTFKTDQKSLLKDLQYIQETFKEYTEDFINKTSVAKIEATGTTTMATGLIIAATAKGGTFS